MTVLLMILLHASVAVIIPANFTHWSALARNDSAVDDLAARLGRGDHSCKLYLLVCAPRNDSAVDQLISPAM
jgi:hypothetical protein